MKSHTLGEVWASMQQSSDWMTQFAGHLNESLNTPTFFLFFWIMLFVVLIPLGVSRLFTKRKNTIYFVVFILSFWVMGSIQNWAWDEVNKHWDMLNNKETAIKKVQ